MSWISFGLKDFKGDLRRFGVILACLILGTSVVTAVGMVGESLRVAVARDAVVLTGGDLEAAPLDGEATSQEIAFLETLGEVTRIVDTTLLTRSVNGTAMADLLAVSSNYPAFGAVESPQLAPIEKPHDLLSAQDGIFGAMLDARLMEKLAIGLGDRFSIGETEFEVRGVIDALPDGAVRGFQLGYPALIGIAAYDGMTGMRAPLPSLLTHNRFKIVLEGRDFETAAAEIASAFGGRSWRIRSPEEVAGDLARYYELFAKFTLLVGLSSLLIGGVGVSNAVGAYIGERLQSIATLRALGATSARIVVHFLSQIGVLALAGVGAGLVLGAVAALVLLPVLGEVLDAELTAGLMPVPLLAAAGFGLLTSFAFSYLPLMRARRVRPAVLFRSFATGPGATGSKGRTDWPALLPVAAAFAAMLGLAVYVARDAFAVGLFAAGAALTLLLLRIAALLLQRTLKSLPPVSSAFLRAALRNIYCPGSQAPVVILSIGLGLAVLVIIGLVSANLQNQLLGSIRQEAPDFVITSLFPDEIEMLARLEAQEADFAGFDHTPLLHARVVGIAGRDPAAIANIPEEAEFMLTGSIPVTWKREIPAHSTLTAGTWWPEDYAGPPLVSLRDTMRFQLGLRLGDTLELEIAGERLVATIASFRAFEWQDGSNLMVTLSPGAIEAFPADYMAVLKAAPGREDALEAILVRSFPDLSFIPVGDALDQAVEVFHGLGWAINLIAALAVTNGVLVLAGTMAAGRRQREADAVLRKVLGATRPGVLTVFSIEHGLLGGLAALLGSAIGIAVAWAITSGTLEVGFVADPLVVSGVCFGAVLLTILVGSVTTWRALSIKPARSLRENT